MSSPIHLQIKSMYSILVRKSKPLPITYWKIQTKLVTALSVIFLLNWESLTLLSFNSPKL